MPKGVIKDACRASRYASTEEFCEIFHQNLSSLFGLSRLLTADEGKAESCFMSALEECTQEKFVFKEWACSWIRRTIIIKAIQLMRPRPSRSEDASFCFFSSARSTKRFSVGQITIDDVFALEDFQRFVFIMSILEKYSHQECSILLRCTRQNVRDAQVQAIQRMGSFAQSVVEGNIA